MKYALIGCGRISPNHFIAAKENNLQVVGLCDLNIENIEKFLIKANIVFDCKRYTNYKEMLAESKPELVAIATESGKHADIALDCIKAGCHVIIEKPIALSLSDADKIIKQAKNMNVKVCVCHQNRFNKSIQKIKEALDAGRFGKLLHGTVHIRWNRERHYYEQAKWRGTWEQDGGALMNQCIHGIDLLRWLLGGEIEAVTGIIGRLKHEYIEAEDLGLAYIKFKDGLYGTIEGTTNVFPSNLEETLFIFGDKGTVKAGGESVNLIDEWRFLDQVDNPEDIKKEMRELPPNVYGFGHTRLYADMINAIKEDREPYVSAQAGRDAIELVLAIYKSCLTQKTVKLPFDRFGTKEMEGYFYNAKK